MHIHLPKAIHGWREFAKEIAIIVIGVLIALGFEQVVEWVHWQHKVEDGEERLRLELAQFYRITTEIVATSPCVLARYDALAARVRDSGERLTPAPMVPPSALLRFMDDTGAVIAPTGRILSPAVLDAIRADGTLLHMSPAQQRRIAVTYRLVDMINETPSQDLVPPDTLAQPIPLDPATRAGLLDRISTARRIYRFRAFRAVQIARAVADLGMAVPGAEVDRVIAERNGPLARECRAEGHPFADWRAAVAAQPTFAQLGM